MIENKSEIKPRLKILRILIERLFQQRFRRSEIAFLDGILRLGNFRRRVIDAFFIMADRGVGLCKGSASSGDKKHHDQPEENGNGNRPERSLRPFSEPPVRTHTLIR